RSAPAWILSLSGLFVGAGLAGCGSVEPIDAGAEVDVVSGPVQAAGDAPVASAVAVPFQEFEDDVGSQAASEVRVLIRTAAGYQRYFGHAAPKSVDLPREWVIFYAAGTKPTGGYDANILSLARAGRSLQAVTELVSPGAGCAVTQSLTSPHVLVKFAAQPGAEIAFKRRDRTQDCPDTNPCIAATCPAGTHCEPVHVL